MNTQKSRFNRSVLLALVVLYVSTIAVSSYDGWIHAHGPLQWWEAVQAAILLLSIPLVFLYGSVYVLVVAWREHSSLGQVNLRLAKVIHWAPRLAAIATICFAYVYSTNLVNVEIQASALEQVRSLVIYFMPMAGMLILLFFAWERSVVGAVVFLASAALFAIFFASTLYSLFTFLFFVLVAGLFYADWRWIEPQPQAQAGTRI